MKYLTLGGIIAIIIVSLGIYSNTSNTVSKVTRIGSTTLGSDYYSTTTRGFSGNSLTNLTVLKTTAGALARVTITGAATGIIRLWDATTTDLNLRTGNTASTSILLADIPASAAANDYDLDIVFYRGLLYELVSGAAPTSTIVWR